MSVGAKVRGAAIFSTEQGFRKHHNAPFLHSIGMSLRGCLLHRPKPRQSKWIVKFLEHQTWLTALWSLHCWKYFYHRSKFGSKNPKLGSNNPFILNLNFKNHLDLACQFLDWQGSELLDKGSNNRIPNMTIVALIQ